MKILCCMKCSSNEIPLKLLYVCLVISLLLNILFCVKLADKDTLEIKGTFQLGSGYSATYLLLDDKGHFCRYTQEEGVLSEGKYEQLKDESYQLVVGDEPSDCLLYMDDRIFFFDGKSKEIYVYTRLSSALVLYDTVKQEWPEWCIVPEER